MNNQDGKYAIELKIINAFLKCNDFSSEKKRLQLYKSVAHDILQHTAETNPFNHFQEAYHFHLLYCESKIKALPFHTVAKRWYSQHKKNLSGYKN
jgi:hypothetical protein